MRTSVSDQRTAPLKNIMRNPRAVYGGSGVYQYTGQNGTTSTRTDGSAFGLTYAARYTRSINAAIRYPFRAQGMQSNTLYTLRVLCRSSRTQAFALSWRNAVTTTANNVSLGTFDLVAGVVTEIRLTFTTPVITDPDNNGFAFADGARGSEVIGDTFDITGCFVTAGDRRDVAFADGDSPHWAWLGTPGLSESAGYPTF